MWQVYCHISVKVRGFCRQCWAQCSHHCSLELMNHSSVSPHINLPTVIPSPSATMSLVSQWHLGLCLCARCQESVLTFTSKFLSAHTNELLLNLSFGAVKIRINYWTAHYLLVTGAVFLYRMIQQLADLQYLAFQSKCQQTLHDIPVQLTSSSKHLNKLLHQSPSFPWE